MEHMVNEAYRDSTKLLLMNYYERFENKSKMSTTLESYHFQERKENGKES